MTLPKRRRRPRTKPLPDRVRSDGHLQWTRGHDCAVSGPGCEGRIQAAHVRIGGDGGMSVKPGDDRVIPLCERHHQVQHNVGESTFEAAHGKPGWMAKMAADLWRVSPHRIRWQQKQRDMETAS